MGVFVLYSNPATFNTPGGAGSATVTFAVPGGSYGYGTWEIVGTHSLGVTIAVTTGSSDSLNLGTASGSNPFDFTGGATTAQLSDINAAAGGNLSVKVSSGGNAASISSFTLTLPGGLFSQAVSGADRYVPGSGVRQI